MKVFFIGAGPGDPELLTLKAARIIGRAELILYAGSLVSPLVLQHAGRGALVKDSSTLTLEQTHALLVRTVRAGGLAARVHTGDPSVYGAIEEQIELLRRDGIDFEIVPGVTAAFAAAAAAAAPLTSPGRSQSFVLTRAAGRTPVPEGGRIGDLAGPGRSMAIYLSAADPSGVYAELRRAGLPDSSPVIIAHAVGWPDECLCRTTLGSLVAETLRRGFTRQTLYLVLPEACTQTQRSRLYAADFGHGFREASDDVRAGSDPDAGGTARGDH